ncbi:hypothetical protein BH23ACT9_BH23ACT9_19970 [soil metagenome]
MSTTHKAKTPKPAKVSGRRRPALDRDTAMRLAADEYQRFLDQMRSLDDDDWARPTDCPAWDVRAMASHNLGMAELVATFREFVRQNVAAMRRPEEGIDALTGLQVDARAAMTPAQIIDRYADVLPRAAAGRRRRARLLGNLTLPEAQPLNGALEKWTFAFLFDTILTRDTWMHRVDTAQATGRPMVLTAEHDGVIIADVVAEWAQRHGAAYSLQLTGPAGGTWSHGSDGPHVEMDAIEFCRTVSRRATGTGLLAVEVPF